LPPGKGEKPDSQAGSSEGRKDKPIGSLDFNMGDFYFSFSQKKAPAPCGAGGAIT
jgi:hypothetical protein